MVTDGYPKLPGTSYAHRHDGLAGPGPLRSVPVTTNPVAPAPAGARTAADVVTPGLVARLTRGVTGSGRTANHTPLTGDKLADLPEATPEEVASAFEAARAAQPAWAAWPVRRRAAVLLRFHDMLLERQAEVLDLIQLETGKARLHAHEEIQAVAMAARHYGRKAPAYLRPKGHAGAVPTLTKVTELRQPRGVIGQIAPWNYPSNSPSATPCPPSSPATRSS